MCETLQPCEQRRFTCIFNSVFALEDMPFLQKEDPDLAGMITYLSTGDLSISDRSARTILMLADQFTLDGGILWHFLSLNIDMAGGNFYH